MKPTTDLILFTPPDYNDDNHDDDDDDRSCKIDGKGVFQFFESPGFNHGVFTLFFESKPIAALLSAAESDGFVYSKLMKIPGTLSNDIQVDYTYVEKTIHNDINVFAASN